MGDASARSDVATETRTGGSASLDPGTRMPSLPFLWWALGLALTAGFGLGTALVLAIPLELPIRITRALAIQAHGHLQIYGWGGMFALGIGLYFLLRLRGCPPPSPRLVRWAATLMGNGLALRGVCQTFALPGGQELGNVILRLGLALSGPLTLAGAGLAVWALVAAARRGPPLRTRTGLLAVLPFAVCFVVTLLLGLALNAIAVIESALGTWWDSFYAPLAFDWAIGHLGLDGMLVAISAAVSARTFPLYLRLRVPPARELHAVAALFLAGFLVQLVAVPLLILSAPADLGSTGADGSARVLTSIAALGGILEGISFIALAAILDVPLRRTRRDLAGRAGEPKSEDIASEWLIVAAYAWLAIAGLLLVWGGLAQLGQAAGLEIADVRRAGVGQLPAPPHDAMRHALGGGLVTLLILGIAPRLVPGFVGRPLYSARLVWATVWLGNGAALLRVAPLFLPYSPLVLGLLALAGALGMAAVACLAWNLWRTAHAPRASTVNP